MDEKQFNDLMARIKTGLKDAIKTEVTASIDGFITTDDLGVKLEAVGLEDGAIKTITDAVEKQGLELREIIQGKTEKPKSMREQLEENKQKFLDVRDGKIRSGSISLKTTVVRAAVADSTIDMRLPGIGQIGRGNRSIAPLFRSATIGDGTGGIIRYIDQAALTNSAAPVAEGAEKPESAITWEELSLPVQKIADTIPVSMEALEDLDFVSSELDRLLNVNLAIVENTQLWSGTGLTVNLTGVLTSSGTYTAPPSSIVEANVYDLVRKIKTSIESAKGSKYKVNYIMMNPADVDIAMMVKKTDGEYIMPPWASYVNDQLNICGVPVFESSEVVANTLLLGDFNYATLYRKGGIKVDFGFIDKQFVENTITMRAEMREALLIRNVDADGFVNSADIAADVALLATDPT